MALLLGCINFLGLTSKIIVLFAVRLKQYPTSDLRVDECPFFVFLGVVCPEKFCSCTICI